MAAVDSVFSAIQLCSMECHQSDSFLQRTSASSVVQPPFLVPSATQLDQINPVSQGSGLSRNGACFLANNPFHQSPMAGGEGMGMHLCSALPMQNPVGTHATSQTCTGLTSRMRKKHKHDQDDVDCPSKRRKLLASPIIIEGCHAPNPYCGGPPQPCWDPGHPQAMPAPVALALCSLPSDIQTIPIEDMEEATVESHSDAVLRRFKDIESRLAEEEEDEDETDDHLPTLVMSDVLLESLKKGLDESLTKKIVDSINRPSMELVLWKPLPERLVDKLQSFTSHCKDEPEVSIKDQMASSTAFLQQEDPLEENKLQTLNVDCGIDPMWDREDEEMEL
ncbi:coiled-coil domain-containing protein 117 [Hyperolius riggenbachi]|uniref:coiled-coil domain-containing protein 117 n=1 Tax=Hyperolius riggenbachi TaxID=752182 RepID=UPI0035A26E2E